MKKSQKRKKSEARSKSSPHLYNVSAKIANQVSDHASIWLEIDFPYRKINIPHSQKCILKIDVAFLKPAPCIYTSSTFFHKLCD